MNKNVEQYVYLSKNMDKKVCQTLKCCLYSDANTKNDVLYRFYLS
jgi:hypothetical protein